MIHFQLVALTGVKFEGDVYEITLPTLDGEIGVLEKHMPLISVVKPGVIAVRREAKDSDAQREFFAASGGVIEVSDNKLRVLVDEADAADELNEAEIQEAIERAQKMKAEATDQVSLDHAQQLVDRHTVRLQVATLKRRHQKH